MNKYITIISDYVIMMDSLTGSDLRFQIAGHHLTFSTEVIRTVQRYINRTLL